MSLKIFNQACIFILMAGLLTSCSKPDDTSTTPMQQAESDSTQSSIKQVKLGADFHSRPKLEVVVVQYSALEINKLVELNQHVKTLQRAHYQYEVSEIETLKEIVSKYVNDESDAKLFLENLQALQEESIPLHQEWLAENGEAQSKLSSELASLTSDLENANEVWSAFEAEANALDSKYTLDLKALNDGSKNSKEWSDAKRLLSETNLKEMQHAIDKYELNATAEGFKQTGNRGGHIKGIMVKLRNLQSRYDNNYGENALYKLRSKKIQEPISAVRDLSSKWRYKIIEEHFSNLGETQIISGDDGVKLVNNTSGLVFYIKSNKRGKKRGDFIQLSKLPASSGDTLILNINSFKRMSSKSVLTHITNSI